MCRNIKTLFNLEPAATDDEIRSAALQFVRKISGYNIPSSVNEAAFDAAVDDISSVAARLLASLDTSAAPRDRQQLAERARQRAARRFGT
jgi:hypothetical protein